MSAHERPGPDEDVRELARELALFAFPPSALALIESALPGVEPGDVEAGRVALMEQRCLPDRFIVSAWIPGRAGFERVVVPLVEADDMRALVRAFQIVARWDRKRRGDEESES